MIMSLEARRHSAIRRAPLGEAHVHLYRALFAHGPMTLPELFASVGVDARMATPLFSQLCARGLVGETDAQRCSVTGRYAARWDVIAGLPQDLAPGCRRPW